MQVLLLYLYPPVEKRDSMLVQKGSQYPFSTGIVMMKHESSTVHIKTVLYTDFKEVTKKSKVATSTCKSSI